MGLVRNYRRCAWLVTYLNGASPALGRSFRPEGHELLRSSILRPGMRRTRRRCA